MVNAINDAIFEQTTSKGFVLVDFWAEWCTPCKQLLPIIEDVEKEINDKITIYKMNIDENPHTPTNFGVRSIPTLILFKEGKVISTKVGSLTKSAIIEWINSEISANTV